MRPLLFVFILILAATMIIIPLISATLFDHDDGLGIKKTEKIELEIDPSRNILIQVYRTSTKKIEAYPLEEYIRGVVAAEMPISFELEALKAQALAARTYIVKRLIDKNFSDVPEGAVVSDTIQHQVFYSDKELRKIWGLHYEERISKLNKAINETSGQVITYQGTPITALFFSTSNGYTENSEDYYLMQVPYLRSVESQWDTQSPKYEETKLVPFSVIKENLKIDPAVLAATGQEWMTVKELSKGNRIKKLSIGDREYTGREVREALELNSSSFTWSITNNGVQFKTTGYGHGVGMSQYGANGMAASGATAEEIVKYYYTGVEIIDIKKWIKQSQ